MAFIKWTKNSGSKGD